MKIVTIVGARPQFIKYGPLGKKLKKNFDEILVHTGQHYDEKMSDFLFRDLQIPKPEINLEIGSHSHGKQTALILEGIEKVILEKKPDLVIVFGDTNSTIAGALAASKLHIKLAHIEAGLRSFNKLMPEEINRILTDHCSDLLLCPTENAIKNLKDENIHNGVFFTGDIMYEAYLENLNIAQKKSKILSELNLNGDQFFLATIHRAENTDQIENLKNILEAFKEIDRKIILPLHPRTKKIISQNNISVNSSIKIIEPVGYLDMLQLLNNCQKVLTDSGGLQKEAFFAKKNCITLRDETEWVETVEANVNVLCGANKNKITEEALKNSSINFDEIKSPFGEGNTSQIIIDIIKNKMN
ncbi:MAG: UDP-N-acetylglucosamine 2-epimerase (non-hydrolyzing) [Ignavibacteriaceae bacterium]